MPTRRAVDRVSQQRTVLMVTTAVVALAFLKALVETLAADPPSPPT